MQVIFVDMERACKIVNRFKVKYYRSFENKLIVKYRYLYIC